MQEKRRRKGKKRKRINARKLNSFSRRRAKLTKSSLVCHKTHSHQLLPPLKTKDSSSSIPSAVSSNAKKWTRLS